MQEMRSQWASVRQGDELFIYWNGKLIYKRWYVPGTNEKRHPSAIINDHGWPTVWVLDNEGITPP